MDWNAAIEKHREALKQVLTSLLLMAGFVGGAPDAHGGHPAFLPRHLHRAVLRLLRPAEAAVRRLVIVAARVVVVNLPPLRPRKRKAKRPPAPVSAIGFRLFDPPSRWGRTRRRPAQICVPRIAFPGVTALSPIRRPPMPSDPIDTTRTGGRCRRVSEANGPPRQVGQGRPPAFAASGRCAPAARPAGARRAIAGPPTRFTPS